MLLIFTFSSEGERDKFEYIYNRYKNLMLRKAYDVLKDYMLAEDAVSEAFIRIYRNLHKIEDPSASRSIAFIVTITKNVSLTLLQKQKGTVTEEYDEDERDSFDLEDHILSEISSERIYCILGDFSEDLKSVFLLKYAYDLSHNEIGRLLHISENNVTVRLHRARKKLAALLQKEGYAGDE